MFEEVKVLDVVVSVRRDGKHVAFNDPEYLKWLDRKKVDVPKPITKPKKKNK